MNMHYQCFLNSHIKIFLNLDFLGEGGEEGFINVKNTDLFPAHCFKGI